MNGSISDVNERCTALENAMQESAESSKVTKTEETPLVIQETGMSEDLKKEIEARFVSVENSLLSLKWSIEGEIQKVTKMIENSVETVKNEGNDRLDDIRKDVENKFQGISDLVYELLPNLITKTIVDKATETAIEECLQNIQSVENKLKEVIQAELKESETCLIRAKEEYFEARIKSLNDKLSVSIR